MVGLNVMKSSFYCLYFSIPVRSIFECLGGGCEVVAMSSDAKYIAVITTGTPQVYVAIETQCRDKEYCGTMFLSLIESTKSPNFIKPGCTTQCADRLYYSVFFHQLLCVWEWTVESEQPLCHATLNTDYGRQCILTFHPTDPAQLVSNSEDTVVFYHWVSVLKIDNHTIH